MSGQNKVRPRGRICRCINQRSLWLQNGNASTRSRRNRSGNSPAATTAMLLAVSFYLIGVTLPVTLCYVLYSRYMEGDFNLSTDDIAVDPTWQAHFRYWAARTIIQEIGMSHYAGNFFIYLATGKQFRTELRTVFAAWCRHCRKAVDRSKESLKMRRMSTISVANNNDDKKSNRNGVSVVTVGNADESNDNSRRTGAVAESLCHQDESARVAVRASELERI